MSEKIILADVMNPYMEKDFVELPDKKIFEFGIMPMTDAFYYAQLEVMEKIQDELKMTDKEFEDYMEDREKRREKIIGKLEKEGKTRIEAAMEMKYSVKDMKYNTRWNKYVIPLQIIHLVVHPDTKEPLFKFNEEVNKIPQELRIQISNKVTASLAKRELGNEEGKK